MFVNKPARLKFSDLLKGPKVNPHPVNPSAYFYHASLHSRIGPYDNREHFAMDLDFLLRAVQAANVRYVDETWGNWRLLEGTKTLTDPQSGWGIPRVKGIIKKYRSNMPILQRWYLALIYEYHVIISVMRHYTQKCGYLIMRPKELIIVLKRRIKLGPLFTRRPKED